MNPFSAFSTRDINAAINLIPNQYGLLGDRNVFPARPVYDKNVNIDMQNNVLSILPIQQRGAPSSQAKHGTRGVLSFVVPQISHDFQVMPDDVLGVRRFGDQAQEALATLMTDRMTEARRKHDITLEWMRMSAMKGLVVDHEGDTLYNLYTEFGITKKVIKFALSNAETDVLTKCLEVSRHIEDNLQGDRMSSVEVLVSQEFFDALVTHPKVKEAYANYQEAANRLGGDMRSGFTFGGLTFREYRATVDGSRFIASGKGHAYPSGTGATFATFVAPGDFNDAVGSPGQLFYASTKVKDHGRGYEVHTQANPLPLCMRPGVLVEVSKDA
jgi:hypothetical protein